MLQKLLTCFFLLLLLQACTGEKKKADEPLNAELPSLAENVAFELKTFEVNDTIKRSIPGWGYDIYKDGKRMIHQPIIPAVPGNNAFPSEELARKVGMYAIEKMKRNGQLPTLSTKELDSLGIKIN